MTILQKSRHRSIGCVFGVAAKEQLKSGASGENQQAPTGIERVSRICRPVEIRPFHCFLARGRQDLTAEGATLPFDENSAGLRGKCSSNLPCGGGR
jgi:hypothetical protein